MSRERKLRLCFTGDASSVHVQKTINFFVGRGHEVHLVDDNPYSYKGLKMHLLKNNTRIKFLDYIIRLIKAPKIIRRIRPDLVYSQQVTYHGFLGALSGVHPFVITPWGADILYDPEHSIINRRIMKFVFDNADIIHYIDQSLMDRVMDVYGDTRKKAFLLNEGVNTKIFTKRKKNKKSNKLSLLCLRSITPFYNSILFVKALNILINEYGIRNIEGVMCNTLNYGGDKKYKEEIDNLIEINRLKKHMRFFKWVKNPSYAQKLMNSADIYVDTMSRSKKGQGTGKTALEAMSMGLAVVMPDNPSIELYVSNLNNGLIYKKNDARSLANALKMMISKDKLRYKIGRKARRIILNKLDWNKNMLKMEKKFNSIANARK
jgi:L-malate glycosyltransferase